jgi:hypothetical protein
VLVLDIAMASSSPFGIIENGLGILSFLFTVAADIAYGHTNFDHVGVDTIVSARSAILGLIPEVNVDYAVSLGQFVYDFQRGDGTLDSFSTPWSFDAITEVINLYWPIPFPP